MKKMRFFLSIKICCTIGVLNMMIDRKEPLMKNCNSAFQIGVIMGNALS